MRQLNQAGAFASWAVTEDCGVSRFFDKSRFWYFGKLWVPRHLLVRERREPSNSGEVSTSSRVSLQGRCYLFLIPPNQKRKALRLGWTGTFRL